MTDPEQDDVFETYLKRRAVLPALEDEIEPPAALDAAVLAEARAAIQLGSGVRSPAAADADVDDAVAASRRPVPVADPSASRGGGGPPSGLTKMPIGRPPRWAVPVALAATVLLCLSVVMNISLNTNRPRSSPNLERMAAARADSKVSALSNATAESNAAAGVGAPRSGAAHDQLADNGERPQSVSGEIASREVVLPRAKVAGVPAPRAPIVVESAAGQTVADQQSAVGARQAAGTAIVAAAPNTSSADAASSPSALTASAAPIAHATGGAGQRPETPTVAAAPAAPTVVVPPAAAVNAAGDLTTTSSAAASFASNNSGRQIAAGPGQLGGAGAVGGAPDAKAAHSAAHSAADEPRMAAADKAVMMAKRAGVASPDYTPGPEASRAAGQAVAGEAGANQQSAAGARQAAAAAGAGGHATEKSAVALAGHPADPKVWLQQINALRAAGKKDQADAEMQRFKKAFPDYAIPAPAPAPAPAGSDLPK